MARTYAELSAAILASDGRTDISPEELVVLATERNRLLRARGLRNLDNLCPDCRGLGAHYYGSTALFWGGMGGASVTPGLCSKCWGSGDASRPWTDLLEWRSEQEAEIERRGRRLFFEACGSDVSPGAWAGARKIVREALAKLPRKRGLDFWTHNGLDAICGRLCKLLDEGDVASALRALPEVKP